MTQLTLPEINAFIRALNSMSTFKWKKTSWIRNSPSHITGRAVDFAPMILKNDYGVNKRRDPFLNKRLMLYNKLKAQLSLLDESVPRWIPTIWIESDHLHVHFVPRVRKYVNRLSQRNRVVQFQKHRGDIYPFAVEEFLRLPRTDYSSAEIRAVRR